MLLKRYLDRKISSIKSVWNWDTLLDLCIPIYFVLYGYIYSKLNLWEGLIDSVRNDNILTEHWFIIFGSYLFLVWVSRVITDMGVFMWRYRDDER